jgi:hypothetical protein
MKAFASLCRWEFRHLVRDGQAWLVCGALLAAAFVAIGVGDHRAPRTLCHPDGGHREAVHA